MVNTVEKKKKKKKGRPSLLDLQRRNLKEQDTKTNYSIPQIPLNYDSATHPLRRSSRRYPSHSSGDNDDCEDKEEEGEEELTGINRREKKMKLVLKLPPSQQKSPVNSDSNLEDGSSSKKRKINSIAIADSKKEDKSVSGANPIINTQGDQLDSGTSTALPDKKLLLFILDRLQKKDTYGVFSEPVDPEELPDYHEVIEHPMDFGTIKKKLDSAAYANLEQFEKDVFLVCSNAMQYNAPDTIYFRQARSIQEIAQKNFDNLRQDSDGNEGEAKVIRRGRPPTKHFKEPQGRPSLERAASEFSSDATLATGQENTLWSNHDMRKGSDKSYFADSSGKFYPGSFTEKKPDRNDEGSILVGYMMKHGKKQFVLDENRRNTYNLFHSSSAQEASVLNTFDGERKQLLTVGVYVEHGYTRSLARFAATLGPVVWEIASKKIEKSLPAGVNFGPGWVGENDIPARRPLQLPSLSFPPGQQTTSLPCSIRHSSSTETREDKQPGKPEADNLSEKPIPASGITSSPLAANRSPESGNEKAEASEGTSGAGFNMTNINAGAVQPRPPLPIHPGMNGYNNGAYGLNLPAYMTKLIGTARPPWLSIQSSQRLDTVPRTATNFTHPATANSNDHNLSENSCTKYPSSPSPNSGRETVGTPRSRVHPQRSSEELPAHKKSDSMLSPKQKPDSRLSPQQKSNSVPPDLNIIFQSPRSPSSNRADSAHPDLALQL